mmetsp:Transcript_117098/g.164647  ORF Transcript_117098/g.164647 Transcript_117098/m.164647 type:complete len:123 (+) Transcript_117098:108-476(+)
MPYFCCKANEFLATYRRSPSELSSKRLWPPGPCFGHIRCLGLLHLPQSQDAEAEEKERYANDNQECRVHRHNHSHEVVGLAAYQQTTDIEKKNPQQQQRKAYAPEDLEGRCFQDQGEQEHIG